MLKKIIAVIVLALGSFVLSYATANDESREELIIQKQIELLKLICNGINIEKNNPNFLEGNNPIEKHEINIWKCNSPVYGILTKSGDNYIFGTVGLMLIVHIDSLELLSGYETALPTGIFIKANLIFSEPTIDYSFQTVIKSFEIIGALEP